MPTKNKEVWARNSRTYYLKNKEKIKAKSRKSNELYRQRVILFLTEKLSSGCVDCGELDLAVLDFDHKDKESKSFTISRGRHLMYSFEKLSEEIEKCEIRCANCHRKRTAKQFGWWRAAA